jgi:hypothetical protein
MAVAYNDLQIHIPDFNCQTYAGLAGEGDCYLVDNAKISMLTNVERNVGAAAVESAREVLAE